MEKNEGVSGTEVVWDIPFVLFVYTMLFMKKLNENFNLPVMLGKIE